MKKKALNHIRQEHKRHIVYTPQTKIEIHIYTYAIRNIYQRCSISSSHLKTQQLQHSKKMFYKYKSCGSSVGGAAETCVLLY